MTTEERPPEWWQTEFLTTDDPNLLALIRRIMRLEDRVERLEKR